MLDLLNRYLSFGRHLSRKNLLSHDCQHEDASFGLDTVVQYIHSNTHFVAKHKCLPQMPA